MPVKLQGSRCIQHRKYRRFRCNVVTARRYTYEGRIKAKIGGNRYLVSKANLREFLRHRQHPPTEATKGK